MTSRRDLVRACTGLGAALALPAAVRAQFRVEISGVGATQVPIALLKLRDARLRAPGNPEIRFHLASALAQSGKRAEAREELINAFRDHPHFPGEAEAKALLEALK